jgi:hypothetical protein
MAKAEVTIVSAQVPNATRAELERRAEANYRSMSAAPRRDRQMAPVTSPRPH